MLCKKKAQLPSELLYPNFLWMNHLKKVQNTFGKSRFISYVWFRPEQGKKVKQNAHPNRKRAKSIPTRVRNQIYLASNFSPKIISISTLLAVAFALLLFVDWKGTHSAPGDGWEPLRLSSDMTLWFAR